MTGHPAGGQPPQIEGWHLLLETVPGVVLLALAALPLAMLAAAALVPVRTRRGMASGTAWRRSIAEVGIVHGTLPFIWLTMLPGSGAGVVPGRVSLVPLRDLATMSTVQVVGNLVLLGAIGLLAPMRFPALAAPERVLALGAACSVLIETLQYVLQLDRVSSVDDVLLNTLGAGLAGLVSAPWWARRSPTGPTTAATTATVRPVASAGSRDRC